MGKVNILLVDDQPGKLLAYQTILEALGENLVMAKSGREALHCLLKEDFALVLLDVVMPEMDGFETATLIRQRPRLERLPIIFLTAYSTSDLDKLKGYELGAVDYVFAPIIPEILRAKVSVFVELYRKRLELARANEQLLDEIAERKRAQEQALQTERLAAIGQMVTGLAHESRNALQQIQACVEMLTRRIQDTQVATLVHGIQKAHDRLHYLLEEVRTYASPLKLDCGLHDVAKLWHEALTQLQSVIQDRVVVVEEQINVQDTRCFVDPFPIEQLFRNIFENALAASKDPVKIKVICEESQIGEKPALRIRIADNGPGLTAEQKTRIFEPFYTTKTKGTGLGMPIALRVAQAHGGQIAVGNDVDCGTAIDVFLPRGQK